MFEFLNQGIRKPLIFQLVNGLSGECSSSFQVIPGENRTSDVISLNSGLLISCQNFAAMRLAGEESIIIVEIINNYY